MRFLYEERKYIWRENIVNRIMIMYHSVKKEVHFLVDDNGSFNEIGYSDCPKLEKYEPGRGDFLLQDQGTLFFDNVVDTFLGIKHKELVFKGTKLDYEDFRKMVDNYNEYKNEKVLRLTEFVELPDVETIYTDIKNVANETVKVFDNELISNNTKREYQKRKKGLEEKVIEIEKNNVNLCIVGTYSAGKSTFINAIIGKKILPESINAETAKMYKISNSKCPSINFKIKRDRGDAGKIASIVWQEELHNYQFTAAIDNDGIKGKIDKVISECADEMEHVQLHNILKAINDLPNGSNGDEKNYVDGMIEVNYPIPLCHDINYTFYDTPGTDSNSREHLQILKGALAKQTNSILIVLYSPLTIQGRGNSILYELMMNSQNPDYENNSVTIDLSRSLHIINQVDRHSKKELRDMQTKLIPVSKNRADEIDETETEVYEYDLQKKRLFFVSSKAAYCAKAAIKKICDEDDKEFLDEDMDKVISKKYYMYDKLSEAEIETKNLIADSDNEFSREDSLKSDDEKNLYKLYVSSGMYAVEQEIQKYAKKYALAVKAKSLYDAIKNIIEGVQVEYEAIESQKRKKKSELEDNIKIMRGDMVKDIKSVFEAFESYLTKENMERQVPELEDIQTKVSEYTGSAEKIVKKMRKIAFKKEKFIEKNKLVSDKLNAYAQDLDEYYKTQRVVILKHQMDDLKTQIAIKIREYKDIDEELINKILSIGETEVPKSVLKPVKIEEYISDEKVLLFFKTIDKDKYKETVVKRFISMTGRQYDSYIKEVQNVAKTKGNELVNKFISNIDELSGALEQLLNDSEMVRKEQEAAKKVLDIANGKMTILDEKIWRSVNE